MIKIFFFDRDGVLIKNYGYLCDVKKIKWLNGAISAINFLNKKKIKVIVITNQSGVARGFFTEKDLKKFHQSMNSILKKYNSKIDNFYYCPYHPNAKIKEYKRISNLRKPNNGMLVKAIKKYKVKLTECFMIGDENKDFLSAKKTKIAFEFKKKYSLDRQIKRIINNYDN